MKHATIIICTKEREELLSVLLHDVQQQTLLPKQVVVIETAQSEPTCSVRKLRKIFPHTVLCTYVCGNFHTIAESRNLGLKHAKYPIIIYVDDDVRLPKTYIKQVLHLHLQYPKALGFVGKIFPTTHDIFAQYSSWFLSQGLLTQRKMMPVLHFAFTTISLVKSTVRKHKVTFDERLSTAEDTDFLLKLRKHDEKVYFHPSLSIQHYFGRPAVWQFCRRFYQYGKNFASIYDRHKQADEVLLYMPKRKLHVFLFPAYVLSLPFALSRRWFQDFSFSHKFLIPIFLYHCAVLFGIYTSMDGWNLVKRKSLKYLK